MRREDAYLVINNVDIFNYYRERLVNMALAEFSYLNFPEDCDRWFFERSMLNNGTASIYNVKDSDIWLSTGYVNSGGTYDVYGYPEEITGVGYNRANIQVEKKKFVVFYDTMTRTSILWMINLYAKKLYEIDMTIRQNLFNQRHPIFTYGNKNDVLTLKNVASRIEGFDNIIELKKDRVDGEEAFKTLDLRVDFKGNELFELLKKTWNEALAMLGISTTESKRERMINKEADLLQMEANTALNSRLMPRVEGMKKLAKISPFKDVEVVVNMNLNTELVPSFVNTEQDGEI